MLRGQLLERLYLLGLRGVSARHRIDRSISGGGCGARGVPEAKVVECQQLAWRVAALRAIGASSLVFVIALAVLWYFEFRVLGSQTPLYLSLGGFLGSWVAAVLGVGGAGGYSRGTVLSVRPKGATSLARCGFLIGILGFLAFFLIAYG